MRRTTVAVIVMGLTLAACGSSKGGQPGGPGGFSTMAALPFAQGSPTPSAAAASLIAVELGETDATHMFIKLSSATAAAGKVTFVVANQGTHTHEFVVLKTDTAAADFPIASFEGEADRIDEDTAGTNVGETGDMKPGETKSLVIDDLQPGHYAVVCNLPGHYRMGMHEDLNAVGSTPAAASDQVAVTLGETTPRTCSSSSAKRPPRPVRSPSPSPTRATTRTSSSCCRPTPRPRTSPSSPSKARPTGSTRTRPGPTSARPAT